MALLGDPPPQSCSFAESCPFPSGTDCHLVADGTQSLAEMASLRFAAEYEILEMWSAIATGPGH